MPIDDYMVAQANNRIACGDNRPEGTEKPPPDSMISLAQARKFATHEDTAIVGTGILCRSFVVARS